MIAAAGADAYFLVSFRENHQVGRSEALPPVKIHYDGSEKDLYVRIESRFRDGLKHLLTIQTLLKNSPAATVPKEEPEISIPIDALSSLSLSSLLETRQLAQTPPNAIIPTTIAETITAEEVYEIRLTNEKSGLVAKIVKVINVALGVAGSAASDLHELSDAVLEERFQQAFLRDKELEQQRMQAAKEDNMARFNEVLQAEVTNSQWMSDLEKELERRGIQPRIPQSDKFQVELQSQPSDDDTDDDDKAFTKLFGCNTQ